MPIQETGPVEIARAMHPICINLGDSELARAFEALEERLRVPCAYVTVCGETSTGKSSIINSLIGRNLLPVMASPTNTSVVNLSLEEGVILEYSSIDRSGNVEIINKKKFELLVTSAPTELLRLRVRLEPKDTSMNGLQVFDTPGYNSVMLEHEEVLRSFIPESDVIVFVTSYRAGFGQVDQDLLDVIQDATSDDPDIPILLVVNRVPKGTLLKDSRVQEIHRNASDCLKFQPMLFLIPAITVTEEDHSAISTEGTSQMLPEADELWASIAEISKKQERLDDVTVKLTLILRQLLDEVDSVVMNRELILSSNMTGHEDIEKQLNYLVSAREDSIKLVRDRMKLLEVQLPRLLEKELYAMKLSLCSDIEVSSRWLGADDCGAWITGHAFQFEGKRVGKSLESYILSELDALNQELEEIANTAIRRIEAMIRVKDTTQPDLARKLAKDIVQRVGGHALRNFLNQLGGACGVAAGAGNLAKMVVKRVGGLFGKRFGQEVYCKISKFFTKGMLKKLNVAAMAIIEAISYLRHVKTWQDKLKKEVNQAIDEWHNELLKVLSCDQIPLYLESNLESVHAVYDSMIRDIKTSLESENHEQDLLRMKSLKTQIDTFRKCLKV